MTAVQQRRWDVPEALMFYAGSPFSSFAPTPGLRLPYGYYGHSEPTSRTVDVPSREHWFQACKAQDRETFLAVLAARSPAEAKRLGSPEGIVVLRPDWERVKVDVMLFAARRQFAREPYRTLLLATGGQPLVEDSPTDFEWGGRDGAGGYTGRNLLGGVLMRVRAEMISEATQTQVTLITARRRRPTRPRRPHATTTVRREATAAAATPRAA